MYRLRTRINALALLVVLALLLTAYGTQPAQPSSAPAKSQTLAPTPLRATTLPAAREAAAKPAVESAAARPAEGAKPAKSIKVALSVGETFSFLPAYVAVERGYFAKRRLNVELLVFKSGSEFDRALAAKAFDIGMTSGPGTALYKAKGVPARMISVINPQFSGMVLVVKNNVQWSGPDSVKGLTLGVTRKGSVTDWLLNQLALKRKLTIGKDFNEVGLGGLTEQLAAIKTGQSDGFVWSIEGAYKVEEEGLGKVVMTFGDMVEGVLFEVIAATDEIIEKDPQAVQAVVDGFYEAVRYMAANKDYTVKFMAKQYDVSERVAAKVYDQEMHMLSKDGSFDDKALRATAESLVSQGRLKKAPKLEDIHTKQFVPAK